VFVVDTVGAHCAGCDLRGGGLIYIDIREINSLSFKLIFILTPINI
jgi:hypothetical protein